MTERITLHLNLHRKHFDAVVSGKKKTEWRKRTDHWAARLEGRAYDEIVFRNGYAPDAPEVVVQFRGVKKVVRDGYPHYAIALGRILRTKNV